MQSYYRADECRLNSPVSAPPPCAIADRKRAGRLPRRECVCKRPSRERRECLARRKVYQIIGMPIDLGKHGKQSVKHRERSCMNTAASRVGRFVSATADSARLNSKIKWCAASNTLRIDLDQTVCLLADHGSSLTKAAAAVRHGHAVILLAQHAVSAGRIAMLYLHQTCVLPNTNARFCCTAGPRAARAKLPHAAIQARQYLTVQILRIHRRRHSSTCHQPADEGHFQIKSRH